MFFLALHLLATEELCRLRLVLDLLLEVAWHCFLAPALAVLVAQCRLRLVLALLLVVP